MNTINILTDTHSHTYPASHDGRNTLAEMVEAAMEKKLLYYGISDHIDFDYDESLIPEEYLPKMKNGDPFLYFKEGRELQTKFKDKINLLVGAEFGFSPEPDVQNRYLEFYIRHKPDYVINSVHSIGKIDYGLAELPNDKAAIYGEYLKTVRQSLDAVYHYDIVGHMEYAVRYVPFEEKSIEIAEFGEQIEDILQTIVDKNKILEVNSSTYKLPRFCIPNIGILKKYYELGGRQITFGSDAHNTVRIGDKRDLIINALKEIGFEYLTIPMRGEYIKVMI